MTNISTEDFLAHYGIKGMRWGVRKRDSFNEMVADRLMTKNPRTVPNGFTEVDVQRLINSGIARKNIDTREASSVNYALARQIKSTKQAKRARKLSNSLRGVKTHKAVTLLPDGSTLQSKATRRAYLKGHSLENKVLSNAATRRHILNYMGENKVKIGVASAATLLFVAGAVATGITLKQIQDNKKQE